MKIFSFLVALLFLVGCASTPSNVPGQSLANSNSRLVKDTYKAVSTYERAIAPKNKHPRIVETSVIRPPGDVKVEGKKNYAQTKWMERWIVDRDGTQVAYLVTYDAKGSRGTSISITLENPKSVVPERAK